MSDHRILLLDDDAISRYVTVDASIDLLDAVYAHVRDGKARASDRETFEYPAGWMRLMGAYDEELGYAFAKVFNRAAGPGVVRYALHLYDLDSGELVAMVDGRQVTDLRTGGMSGLVAGAMVGDRPVTVGIVGAGNQGRAQLAAIDARCTISGVKVFGPTPANRERFAAELGGVNGYPVTAVDSAREAVDGVDVVVLATSSKSMDAVIEEPWLHPQALVLAVGSTRPTSAEVDTATMLTADSILVDTIHCCEEAGEVKAAIEADPAVRSRVTSLETAPPPGPASRGNGRVVFKSVGSAVQDLALAAVCYEAALADDAVAKGLVGSGPGFLSVRRPAGATLGA